MFRAVAGSGRGRSVESGPDEGDAAFLLGPGQEPELSFPAGWRDRGCRGMDHIRGHASPTGTGRCGALGSPQPESRYEAVPLSLFGRDGAARGDAEALQSLRYRQHRAVSRVHAAKATCRWLVVVMEPHAGRAPVRASPPAAAGTQK